MMLNLPGYQETNQIYAGKHTLVYRAIRQSDRCRVVIKVLRNPFPRFNDLVRFRNQYMITRHLEHPTIVRPLAWERHGNGYALVMPDEGAIALSKYWPKSNQNLINFLRMAIQPLLDAFERVAEGNREMMLVAGFSGIGKTSVVNEVHKPIVKQRGYFIKGKFDVFSGHLLMLTLADLQKQGANLNTLTLPALNEGDISRLVADTLVCSEQLAASLSQLVYQKTQGNPFFATQFLQGLHEDGYIAFAPDVGYWQCDLTQVRQLALTDDVVEFIVRRLQKLAEATQGVLRLAACIGNQLYSPLYIEITIRYLRFL